MRTKYSLPWIPCLHNAEHVKIILKNYKYELQQIIYPSRSYINFFFGKLGGLYTEQYMRENSCRCNSQKLISVCSYQFCCNSHKPSFLSSAAIFTLVSVISLKEARKSTTSPFSFFMGTISSRHQNEDPARIKN